MARWCTRRGDPRRDDGPHRPGGAELLHTCASGGDVLVFAHGHSLTALTIRWLGLPITHGRHLRLGTGAVSLLGWKRVVRVLEVWNGRSHIHQQEQRRTR